MADERRERARQLGIESCAQMREPGELAPRRCNLYSITADEAAIIALFRVMNR